MNEIVTPRDLSHELKIPQKRIRDYLRSEYGLLAAGNETRWRLNTEQATKVRQHFSELRGNQ